MDKLIGLVILIALPNCASITRGTTDVLQVFSTPQGAQVSTANGYSCLSTSYMIKMPCNTETIVTISKSGCEPVQVNVTNKIANAGSASMAGNIFVGGIIGVAVDAGSGAMNDLVPNPVNVTLNGTYSESDMLKMQVGNQLGNPKRSIGPAPRHT